MATDLEALPAGRVFLLGKDNRMFEMTHAAIRAWAATLARKVQRDRGDDRGASVVETVVIAAGLAALALSTMAAIKALVDGKLADITL